MPFVNLNILFVKMSIQLGEFERITTFFQAKADTRPIYLGINMKCGYLIKCF